MTYTGADDDTFEGKMRQRAFYDRYTRFLPGILIKRRSAIRQIMSKSPLVKDYSRGYAAEHSSTRRKRTSRKSKVSRTENVYSYAAGT